LIFVSVSHSFVKCQFVSLYIYTQSSKHFRNSSHLNGRWGCRHNFGRGPPKDHISQVWFIMVQWVHRNMSESVFLDKYWKCSTIKRWSYYVTCESRKGSNLICSCMTMCNSTYLSENLLIYSSEQYVNISWIPNIIKIQFINLEN
jgi:hypothetical protein